MEAGLIALTSTSEEANWLRHLLYEIPLWEKPIPPILIYCDNTATIGKVKNRYCNGKSKPIRRKHSTMRSYLSGGIITMIILTLMIILQIHLLRPWQKIGFGIYGEGWDSSP